MSESYAPETVVCRVCHTALNHHATEGKTTYRHSDVVIRQYGTMITDHEPDPITGVPVPDMIGVCDFCGEKRPRWTYKCESFIVDGVPGDVGYGMISDWAACDTCHALIELDSWHALAARSIKHYPDDGPCPPAMRAAIRSLQQQFRTHRTGEVVDEWAPTQRP